MNNNPRITLDTSLLEAAVKMSEGNPGAATVVGQLLSSDPVLGVVDICHLDDMEIYGSDIWLCYKDVCGEDLAKLQIKIRDRSIKKELEALPHYQQEKRKQDETI